MVNVSKSTLLLAAAPLMLTLALYNVNWPRTIFRFIFGVVAPTKERIWPSDDTSISPAARGIAWVLLADPPPHDLEALRDKMKNFWPYVWPPVHNSIKIEFASLMIPKKESLLFTPSDPAPGMALLHLHGGGLVAGTTGTERGLMAELAHRLNVPVLSVDYRLVPENTVEDAVDDVVVAYKWLLEKFPDREISFFGGSAGAVLSLLSALKIRTAVGADKQPKSLVLSSPGPGMEFIGETEKNEWTSLEKNALKDGFLVGGFYPYITSLVYTKDNQDYFRSSFNDLTRLPPCLVTAGSYEVILSGIQNLEKALKQAGVSVDYREYGKMQHCHVAFFEFTPESSQALDEVVLWLKESWAS